ncbi:MAG: lytic transglycosylase [Rickettsiales bacterium]|nr:MAG: lytic transglycosylase [Rickettsiales bacterium]
MRRVKSLLLILIIFKSFAIFAHIDRELLESQKCSNIFGHFEKEYDLPKDTLYAISLQETQKTHSKHNIWFAWPWTINVGGKGYYFKNKEEAIKFARAKIKSGKKSIDVGCMQINLKYHAKAFDSLEEAFTPAKNIAYAAKMLKDNHRRFGSWREAIGRYHSGIKKRAVRYHASVNRIISSIDVYKKHLRDYIIKSQKRNEEFEPFSIQISVASYLSGSWFRASA